MNLDKVDVLSFRIKEDYFNKQDFEGSNEFIKTKDKQGDTKRIREYSNVQESTTLNFEKVYKLYKLGVLEAIQGNLYELE